MRYPRVYHAAHAHIVAFGGHQFPQMGRSLIAAALRELRSAYKDGRISVDSLHWERDHFRYVGHPIRTREV